MRILATIAAAAMTLALSLAAAEAACSSGVSRNIPIGASHGMDPNNGLFLPNQVLRDHEVVLTFDDGPLPGTTTRILRTLNEYCVKATFFVVGTMARANPQLVRQLAAHGHTVGTHSFSHANLAGLSRASAIRQIRRGVGAIDTALGSIHPAPFFRFPYLAETSRLRRYLADNNVTVFGAPLIDSEDYRGRSGASTVRRVMAQLDRRGRGVILMHDIKRNTASMLPALLDALEEKGYSIVHLIPSSSASANLALNDNVTRSGSGGQSASSGSDEMVRGLGSDDADNQVMRFTLSPDNIR
jgi:peptidoglycan/xylan/chitin deacetylase (PgdA/CDA1 family)